jgi:hypothetical protein
MKSKSLICWLKIHSFWIELHLIKTFMLKIYQVIKQLIKAEDNKSHRLGFLPIIFHNLNSIFHLSNNLPEFQLSLNNNLSILNKISHLTIFLKMLQVRANTYNKTSIVWEIINSFSWAKMLSNWYLKLSKKLFLKFKD